MVVAKVDDDKVVDSCVVLCIVLEEGVVVGALVAVCVVWDSGAVEVESEDVVKVNGVVVGEGTLVEDSVVDSDVLGNTVEEDIVVESVVDDNSVVVCSVVVVVVVVVMTENKY